jgi:lysophospholipase L1-like esterase
MKQTLKVIAVNIFVIAALITLGNFLAVSGIRLANAMKPYRYARAHLYPNYDHVDWALDHFTEYANLTKGFYEAFYGWRRPEMHGKTINIDENGRRRTFRSSDTEQDRVIAFFGGSTTWGTGVDDESTIPSFFAKLNPNYEAINYGETGYVAHQSLNLLMKEYFGGFRPDVVVFYDGVNDVGNKCLRNSDVFSHSRENMIRDILRDRDNASYLAAIDPMIDFVGRAKRTLQGRQQPAATSAYDCHENPAKAEAVARYLLSDWSVAKHLVESGGGEFVAILQPQAYDGTSRLDHLDLPEPAGWQYAAVYPKIVELLDREFPELRANFVDLRRALDQDGYFYIDQCHLSPNGNEIIARRIDAAIASRTMPATAQRDRAIPG